MCSDYAIKGDHYHMKQFITSWMKTNKPESIKTILADSVGKFHVPKGEKEQIN